MPEGPYFVERLKQRALVRWGLGYLALAWVILQVLGFLADAFGWPEAVVRVATVVAGFGLFGVLTAAWFHAERGHQRVTRLEGGLFAAIVCAALAGSVLVARSDAPAARPGAAAQAPEQGSIAVLPFASLSPGEDDVYFADGVTEEILNALTRVPGLRVAARTSVFQFRDAPTDVRTAGRRLGVAAVLEGSVRRDGQRLRIAAQLVNVADGLNLWGDTYDRDAGDALAVQEEIAREIVAALRLRLGQETEQLVRARTSDPEAYELYLQGRHLWNQRTGPALVRAIEYLERAVARDSTFAIAHAALADSYLLQAEYGNARTTAVSSRVVASAMRALELDATLAEPHVTLGSLYQRTWQWADAESAFRRALTLEPESPSGNMRYGLFLRIQGRYREAAERIARARRSDPLSANTGTNLVGTLGLMGAHEEALAEAQRLVNVDGGTHLAHAALGIAHISAGRYENAIPPLQRATRIAATPNVLTELGVAYALSGRTADARVVAERLRRWPAGNEAAPTGLARIHVALGELDAAFAVLERAADSRLGQLPRIAWWRAQPEMRAATRDPRYARLLGRMGLAG